MNKFRILVAFFCALALPVHAVQIRGKVVAPDGASVADAVIWAGEAGLSDYSEKDGSLRQLTSGEDGTFALEIADKPGKKPMAFARVSAAKFAVADAILNGGDNAITLEAPKLVRGSVRDEKGVPVADIPVRAFLAPYGDTFFGDAINDEQYMFYSLLAWARALPPLETRSGTDGIWQFDNLNLALLLLAEPRFAVATALAGWPGLPADNRLNFKLQVGATLQGRLLNPDGEPLAGVLVMGGEDFLSGPARTNADGQFTLSRLVPGSYTLVALASGRDFVVPMLNVDEPLEAGKVNLAPEWKATRGVIVTGLVVDKKTGAPLPNVAIFPQQGDSCLTGADGRFRLRTLLGRLSLRSTHPDFGAWNATYEEVNGATFDTGRIALERAVAVKGRVLDDKGLPLANAALLLTVSSSDGKRSSYHNGTTDADGRFEVRDAPGAVTLRLSGEEWELVPDGQYAFALGEKTPPFEVRARRTPVVRLASRVVTPSGRAVDAANVTVTAEVKSRMPGQPATLTTKREAMTDAQGQFFVDFTGEVQSATVSSIAKAGHVVRKVGQGKALNGVWTLPESVVAPLNNTVSGVVRDVNGVPVPQSWVASPDATSFAPVQTDAQGRFTLTNLPEGDVSLCAARGADFAKAPAHDGKVQLDFTGHNILVAPMRRQFFEKFRKDGLAYLAPYWTALGSEKILAWALQEDLALPFDDFDVTHADWSKAVNSTPDMLRMAVIHDPAWLAARGPALLKILPVTASSQAANSQAANSEVRFYLEADVARAAALRGDAVARQWATIWLNKAKEQKDKPNNNTGNASRLFTLAGISYALQRPDAQELLLAALNYANLAGKAALEMNADVWGGLLGPGGVELFTELEKESDWPREQRIAALTAAIIWVAPVMPELAGPLLEKRQALGPTAGEEQRAIRRGVINRAEWAYRRAQANSEPGAVLQWLEEHKPDIADSRQVLRGAIVQAAWRQKQFDVAARAMRGALALKSPAVEQLAYFGALAATFDEPLSKELFAAVEVRAFANDEAPALAARAHLATFRATYEPEKMRLLLEDVWQRLNGSTDETRSNQQRAVQADVAGAMLAFDALRALEMLNEVPDGYEKNAVRARFAAYLLAGDATVTPLHADFGYS